MENSSKLQNRYIDLYAQLRNYIWTFETVKLIADLEVEVFKAFPDIELVQSILSKLELRIMDTISEDEELEKAVKEFKSEAMSVHDIYHDIVDTAL